MTIDVSDNARLTTEKVYRYFATTVNLLTSYDGQGQTNIMACEWTMQISYRPLKVLCVVNKRNLTYEVIAAGGEFGVNLCAEDQASLSHFTGDVSGRDVDKLSDSLVAGTLYPARHIRAPMIKGSVLNVECALEETLDLGNYAGFIGRAVHAQADPAKKPLFYHQGKYFRLGERIPKPVDAA